MKQRTLEWIAKAEGDWVIAQREREAPSPVWEGICFHAQQCAEKYMKAVLEEQNIPFGKTHDLVYLMQRGTGLFASLEPIRADLAYLSTFGIAARYPGADADEQIADDALHIAGEVRRLVRNILNLP